MAGNTPVLVENLDHAALEPYVHLPTDEGVRNGIEGLVDLDMVIGMNLGGLPLGIFEGRIRQGFEGRLLQLLEQFAAAFADVTHRSVVQILQKLGDRGIELGQREEGPVPQPGEDPALHDQHGAFDLGLVPRFAAACLLTSVRHQSPSHQVLRRPASPIAKSSLPVFGW